MACFGFLGCSAPPATRLFSCPMKVSIACNSSHEGRQERGITGHSTTVARAKVVEAARRQVPVNLSLWMAYIDWVDKNIAGRNGNTLYYHRFVCASALGLDNETVEDVTSGDAGNIIAVLVEAGIIMSASRGNANEDLVNYLLSIDKSFHGLFVLAKDRKFRCLGQEEEGEWKGDYSFIQLADPQLGMLHKDKAWSEETTMLSVAVQHINRLKPRFLLICGNLINAHPANDPNKHQAAAHEVADFKECLRELDPTIPVILQPGNHDIGHTPTPEDLKMYIKRFGDDYFSFWVGGVFYLNINSQYYVDSRHVQAERQAQDDWIQAELAMATGVAEHIVILSSIPPFVGDEDDEHGWATWQIEPRRRVIATASKAGAKLWLAGHLHSNCVTHTRSGIEVVATSAIGSVINWTKPLAEVGTVMRPDFDKAVGTPPLTVDMYHSGMRIVHVKKSGIEHAWCTLNEMPGAIQQPFGVGPLSSDLDRQALLEQGLLGIDDKSSASSGQ